MPVNSLESAMGSNEPVPNNPRINHGIINLERAEKALAINSLGALTTLDRTLQEAIEPLPVASFSATPLKKSKMPVTWVGFGLTIPGTGLVPVQKTMYGGENRIQRPGHTIPLIEASRSSVNYFPFSFDEHEDATSQGYWHRWFKHRFEVHGDEGLVHEKEEGLEDAEPFGKDFLSIWLKQEAPFHSPAIAVDKIDDPESVEISSGFNKDNGGVRFIAVGHGAVQSFFNAALFRQKDNSNLPNVYKDMLGAVAKSLDISAS